MDRPTTAMSTKAPNTRIHMVKTGISYLKWKVKAIQKVSHN